MTFLLKETTLVKVIVCLRHSSKHVQKSIPYLYTNGLCITGMQETYFLRNRHVEIFQYGSTLTTK